VQFDTPTLTPWPNPHPLSPQDIIIAEEEAKNSAVLQLQRVHRGKQAREFVNQQKLNRIKSLEELTAEQEAAVREEAVRIIQRATRGKQGRIEAQKQVKPFSFSCGGLEFKHRGRRKSTVGTVLDKCLHPPPKREEINYSKPWLHNARQVSKAEEEEAQEVAEQIANDNDAWLSLVREAGKDDEVCDQRPPWRVWRVYVIFDARVWRLPVCFSLPLLDSCLPPSSRRL